MTDGDHAHIQALFPPTANVTCVTALIVPDRDIMLYPSERRAVANATPSRQREFAAGRQAARQALANAGFDADELPVTASGAPLWPPHVVGSIAHAEGLVVVVVAPATDACRALGVDIVRIGPDVIKVAAQFLTAQEQQRVASSPDGSTEACVLLACKEAALKAVGADDHESEPPRLEDMHITPAWTDRRFTFVHDQRADESATRGEGAWKIADAFVFASAIIMA